MNNDVTEFISQVSNKFLKNVISERGESWLNYKFSTLEETKPLRPVIIDSIATITSSQIDEILFSYNNNGGAYIIPLIRSLSTFRNPIFDLADKLRDSLRLYYPLTHPLEGHPEATKRFGLNDHTFKIYDLPKEKDGVTYREVAETNEPFEVHQDGLGSGGTVQTLILYANSIPLFGGYTFVYDMTKLAMAIYNENRDAFVSLFEPDAITAIRPRGKGAIKVVSPILYLDKWGKNHTFYRKNSGEYKMQFKQSKGLAYAIDFLNEYTSPFAKGSSFISYAQGSFLVVRNRDFAHGRTGFIDGINENDRRLLSRKWYMVDKENQQYKHVPGIFADEMYMQVLGGYFRDEYCWGEWGFDPTSNKNLKIT